MCMSIKDYMSKEQLENYNNNDVTQERIGGMTHYTRSIDYDKCKNCKIVDPMQELLESNFLPQPSLGGTECQGNGKHDDIEIQCDECDYYLECFPENK